MLNLQVPGHLAPSEFKNGPIPGCTTVAGPSDDPIGELLVWVDDGYISALEFAWWSTEPPDRLPDATQLLTTRR
jgi:hypothetical protein